MHDHIYFSLHPFMVVTITCPYFAQEEVEVEYFTQDSTATKWDLNPCGPIPPPMCLIRRMQLFSKMMPLFSSQCSLETKKMPIPGKTD